MSQNTTAKNKKSNKSVKYNVIDLYCGVGGFSLGTARAGFNLIGAIDHDPIMVETHKKNFPLTNHKQYDLSKVNGKQIKELLGIEEQEIHGIVGGPPCQGFSLIGQNHVNDKRNRLFVQFFQLVKELKPMFFVCENVPGILRTKFDKTRESAFDLVRNSYYISPPIPLIASEYGVPTTRKRIFFIGLRKTLKIKFELEDILPKTDIVKINVEQALLGLPKSIRVKGKVGEEKWRIVRTRPQGVYGNLIRNRIPSGVGDEATIQALKNNIVSGFLGTDHERKTLNRWRKIGQGKIDAVSRTIRLNAKGYCPTLRAGTASDKGSFQSLRPIHPTENRVITTREAARLQGFPDWFLFHPTKWHSFRQIGNSVSPILVEKILKVILKKIKN